MESLAETLPLFTDTQLNFLSELEQLCLENDSVSCVDKDEMENEQTSKSSAKLDENIYDDRERLEQHLEGLINRTPDSNQTRFKRLNVQHGQCLHLLSLLDCVLERLQSLKQEYEFAATKTSSLHCQCERITQQQDDLLASIDKIEKNLIYFRRYERLHACLSQPLSNLLSKSNELASCLEENDECISFVQSHSNFLESQAYRDKFLQLKNQTLLTVKNHVILELQMKTAQIVPQADEQLTPGENVFTLFYGKFQQFSQRLRPLLVVLENGKHLDDTSENYLNECYQAYVNSRESLISPILTIAISEMVAGTGANASTLQIIRNSGRMVFHICRDELQLYFNFFEKTSSQLISLLDGLCTILYDGLRPLIIKCNHLETLAEIGHILKMETVDEEAIMKHEELQSFIKIVDILLQDVQERLIFRTNLFIQNEILGYNPADGDLAYPEKLRMLSSSISFDRAEDLNRTTTTTNNSSALHRGLSRSDSMASLASTVMSCNTFSDVTLMPFDVSDRFGSSVEGFGYHLWYPTVRRAIMCLTKLFRTLDSATFQGLAQDVIAACIQSLDAAAHQISKSKTALDAYLFVIKHLLIIREQIAPFKIECTVREVSLDFTRVKDAAVNLFHKSGSIFSISTNNGLLSLLFEVPATAQVMDHVLDSQKIVDTRIKSACEILIEDCGNRLTSRVEQLRNQLPTIGQALLSECKTFNHVELEADETNEGKDDNLDKKSNQLLENHLDSMIFDLQKIVFVVRSSMSIYLNNDDTEAILFKPIKSRLVKALEALEKQIKLVFSEDQLNEIQFSASKLIKHALEQPPESDD